MEPNEFRRLTDDANKIFELVEELDAGQHNYDVQIGQKWGTLEKLRKTSNAMDNMINGQFSRVYGVDGIGFSNMEQVHSPIKSGKGTMKDVRQHLLARGMTEQFADILAAKYIRKLEDEGNMIVPIMDFFDSRRDGAKALQALATADMNDVALNYETLDSYTRSVNQGPKVSAVRQALQSSAALPQSFLSGSRISPIRPQRQAGMRSFSSENDGKRGRFFDFLRSADKADEEAKVAQEEPK